MFIYKKITLFIFRNIYCVIIKKECCALKTLEELLAVKEKVLKEISLRESHQKDISVVVCMSTCGIASGARSVLSAFLEEIQKLDVKNIVVTQTGCAGMCKYEPIVEVTVPGQEKVTYVNVTPEKVSKVVAQHIVNNNVCKEYTIS